MDSQIWIEANQVGTNGEMVVGWYHSHPNLGAFFSGTDRRTQQAFLGNAFSIGWVIDPVRNRMPYSSAPIQQNIHWRLEWWQIGTGVSVITFGESAPSVQIARTKESTTDHPV